jgi:hypothetical protein
MQSAARKKLFLTLIGSCPQLGRKREREAVLSVSAGGTPEISGVGGALVALRTLGSPRLDRRH